MIDINKRETRARRVVTLQFKGSKTIEPFLTCPEIYLKYEKDKLGICLNALWNALSKNGRYENKLCRISYQSIEQLKTIVWE